MTLTLSLSADTEARLTKKAEAQGIDLPTLAAQVLKEEADRPEKPLLPDQATLDLLKRWNEEQATNDPEEIARGEAELRELMEGLNESRRLCEGPNARTPFP